VRENDSSVSFSESWLSLFSGEEADCRRIEAEEEEKEEKAEREMNMDVIWRLVRSAGMCGSGMNSGGVGESRIDIRRKSVVVISIAK